MLESGMAEPRTVWKDHCDAARDIRHQYGPDKALGYLVGKKFLSFLRRAKDDQEWRAELPAYVAKIKSVFGQSRLATYLERLRQQDAGDDAEAAERSAFRIDPLDLLMVDWAFELLVDDPKP